MGWASHEARLENDKPSVTLVLQIVEGEWHDDVISGKAPKNGKHWAKLKSHQLIGPKIQKHVEHFRTVQEAKEVFMQRLPAMVAAFQQLTERR